jgi:hypothetical protein
MTAKHTTAPMPTGRLFPPWDDVAGPACKPMGMPMSQNRYSVPTWSYAMERLPPKQIVEIGSYTGALATLLGVHARMIGCSVITYDIAAQSEDVVPVGKALGVDFRVASCWEREREIAEIIQREGTTFVLCDGGDKLRELATFARYLKPGDIIGAHDYDAVHEVDPSISQLDRYWPWSEVRRADATEAVTKAWPWTIEPWLQEHFDCAGWIVFRKVAP